MSEQTEIRARLEAILGEDYKYLLLDRSIDENTAFELLGAFVTRAAMAEASVLSFGPALKQADLRAAAMDTAVRAMREDRDRAVVQVEKLREIVVQQAERIRVLEEKEVFDRGGHQVVRRRRFAHHGGHETP